MEEHNIVLDGDIIVGNHSDVRYGLIADSAILGERVEVSGDINARSDIRIDIWSHIGGTVKTKENAYIGEFVTIDGKLVVKGDLDIGNNVKISDGFEARANSDNEHGAAHQSLQLTRLAPRVALVFPLLFLLWYGGSGEQTAAQLSFTICGSVR